MRSLYPLSELYQNLERSLTLSSGEITPDIELLFSQIQTEKDDKLEALACLLKNANAEIEMYQKEELRLRKIRESIEARTQKLEALAEHLLPHDEKWSSGVHKLSFRESKVAEVLDYDIRDLPHEFLRYKTTMEPDKAKIKAAIESGTLVPGAQISTRYNLQIK